MASSKKQPRPVNEERAKRTLYVTGFNSKHTTERLLKELFTQGGPVKDIAMFDSHAYVQFQHEESVPYCLALFNEVELFGTKLRLNPRYKSSNMFSYLKYLSHVRTKLRDEYTNMKPPELPPKEYSAGKDSKTPERNGRSVKRTKSQTQIPSEKKNKKKKTNQRDTKRPVSQPAIKTKRGKRGGNKKKTTSRKIVKTLR